MAAMLLLQRSKAGARRVTLASLTAQRAPPGAAAAGGGDDGTGDDDAFGAAVAAAAAAAGVAAGAGAGAHAAGDGGVTLALGGACEVEVCPMVDGETGVDALAGATQLRQQALHRCRWSRRTCSGGGDGATRLLAAAGAAGVLRVLRVRVAE